MPAKLDDLPAVIANAGDSGITKAKLEEKFAGKAKAKDSLSALEQKLTLLIKEGTIRGPFKFGRSRYYFAGHHGPSVDTARTAIVTLISNSDVKLLSKPGLRKKITGPNARFFDDGLADAVAGRVIVELSCGSSKYYLHRDVAADRFGFEAIAPESPTPSPKPPPAGPARTASSLTLDGLLPAYRRLKAEQGGFSAVKIFDLMHAVNGSKDDLHRLLIEESQAGRVTIHPTTSVELPKEVIEAGIRLPGHPEPYVTVVVKSEP
jgi:hypothetical protein